MAASSIYTDTAHLPQSPPPPPPPPPPTGAAAAEVAVLPQGRRGQRRSAAQRLARDTAEVIPAFTSNSMSTPGSRISISVSNEYT